MSEKCSPQVLRLFIAISVPYIVQKRIEKVQRQLQRRAPPESIQWSPSGQFHITLNFLGDVHIGRVDSLKRSVFNVCANRPPMRLTAHGIGFFPNMQNPRVIWVRTDNNSGQLAKLQDLLDNATRPFSHVMNKKNFTGHITLGRFEKRSRVEIGKFIEYAKILRQQHFGDWVAKEVEVVHSDLTSAGSIHTPIASCPLALLSRT